MHVEQTLIKCTKNRSVITHGEGIIECHSICNEEACAISSLINVSSIGGERHDLTDARMARDFKDMKKVRQFFIDHNSFIATSTDLWNILNGIKGDKNIAIATNADITGKAFKINF